MPVNFPVSETSSLNPVAGVRLGVARAGIRKAGRKDLLVISLAQGSSVAGVFTRNRFRAAPVIIGDAPLVPPKESVYVLLSPVPASRSPYPAVVMFCPQP